MKNFNARHWNETLATFTFCSQAEAQSMDINSLAVKFAYTINDALDICTPKKVFTIRPDYVQGLTEQAFAKNSCIGWIAKSCLNFHCC